MAGGVRDTSFDVDDGIIAELEALGAPPEVIENARRQIPPEPELEIFADNIAAVEMFQAMQTQWRSVAGAERVVRLGIDYTALLATINAFVEPADRKQMFDDVRIMELETLKVEGEKEK